MFHTIEQEAVEKEMRISSAKDDTFSNLGRRGKNKQRKDGQIQPR